MAQPYVGEIRIFAGNFAPAGWAFCDGQELPISENETLYQLIGTTYGGDGQSTFALPDLRGRVPVHFGAGTTIAQTGGVEAVTLTTTQIPVHAHPVIATTSGQQISPSNGVLAKASGFGGLTTFKSAAGVTTLTNLTPTSLKPAGGSQPHENRQPYLALNFIISLFGIFPSPT